MGGCLDESTVLAFLGGTLPPDERTAIEAHIAACSACADLVTWAAADQASSTDRLPGHEGRPFVGQLQPGSRVGRYQVLGAVGRGGMGEVYAAYHPDLDRRIAVKVVQGAGGNTAERRVRLLREARAIARLRHPNVVTVHDAGTFGDRVFIAMELVDGATIEQWLRAERRDWRRILDVFVAAGRGLAAAHAAGVVHRDFKPQNVMIAKDGSVRVMDFGLARLAEDETPDPRAAHDDETTVSLGPVTKTGAFIGTPAYMSPEQFRREATDARSDQFSFCVGLHEALFGARPATAVAGGGSPTSADSAAPRAAGIPGWLRAVVLRGAAPDRERRWPSMDALLDAIDRGRTQTRRRLSAVAAVAAVVLLSASGWKVARGNRFACAVPRDRVATAWSTDAANPRRQAIHRAFATSGRDTAETSWQRASKVLDDYMRAWDAMYLQSCEATHLRGEQSAEVLDLRMSCLNDNLDQVRALTDALATADNTVVSRAVTAASSLTPVSRCGDVPLLKSAVPLPKDEKTLHEVERLRREIAQVQAMFDLGSFRTAVKRSNELRPDVEATGYKPLLGEILVILGTAETVDDDPSRGEATLREAMIAAEAAGDGVTAAKVAASLVYVTGYRLGRPQEAEFWARIGHACLDRLGGDQRRIRSWIIHNLAGVRVRDGDFEGARVLLARAASLKEESLGKEHPDLAISLTGLAYVLTQGGHPEDALVVGNRAVDIVVKHGDPDSYTLSYALSNQGEAFIALARYPEAERAFENALHLLAKNVSEMHPEAAEALHGLGETKLAQGAPLAAIPLFEQALRIRLQPHSDPVLLADSKFGLARALRTSGGEMKRARSLAVAALETYQNGKRTGRQRAVEAWLADSKH